MINHINIGWKMTRAEELYKLIEENEKRMIKEKKAEFEAKQQEKLIEIGLESLKMQQQIFLSTALNPNLFKGRK